MFDSCPKRRASMYYNYKIYFFIVLLTVVDGNYKFIFTGGGSYDKEGDSGCLDKNYIGKRFFSVSVFPQPCNLPRSDIVQTHVLISDEAL